MNTLLLRLYNLHGPTSFLSASRSTQSRGRKTKRQVNTSFGSVIKRTGLAQQENRFTLVFLFCASRMRVRIGSCVVYEWPRALPQHCSEMTTETLFSLFTESFSMQSYKDEPTEQKAASRSHTFSERSEEAVNKVRRVH